MRLQRQYYKIADENDNFKTQVIKNPQEELPKLQERKKPSQVKFDIEEPNESTLV